MDESLLANYLHQHEPGYFAVAADNGRNVGSVIVGRVAEAALVSEAWPPGFPLF